MLQIRNVRINLGPSLVSVLQEDTLGCRAAAGVTAGR